MCGFRGSPPRTRHSQSSALPPDDAGELPFPVLSAFLTGSPASFSTGRCKPVRVENRGPWGPGRPTASHHFPPCMKQYSLVRLTSSRCWAELGTGAARIHGPGAGSLTVSWDKHTQSQTVVPHSGCSTRAHTKHSVSPEERVINFEEGEGPGQGVQEDSLQAGRDSEHTGGVPPPPWSPIWPLPPSLVSPTQDASLTSSCIALVLS